MPDYTGTELITQALREIKVLDPIQVAEAEHISNGEIAGTNLLDSWRTEKLTISGVTISQFALVAATSLYTIGPSATFDQAWPERIEKWSVIPDDTATNPLELPMGDPLTFDQWQQVRIKTQSGRPNKLYYDQKYDASGFGRCYFHPVPSSSLMAVRLYAFVPDLVSLVAGTTYHLRPGAARALILELAMELADPYGKDVTTRLERRAMKAKGLLLRTNYRPRQAQRRGEFAIGNRNGRNFNVYTGGNG